jgi:ATP-dependent RNA helicase DDX51/DBP6
MGDGESPKNDKDDESAKLKLLKKHIEKRKRKLAAEKKDIDEANGKSTEESSPKKDKKISKEGRKKGKKDEILVDSNVVDRNEIFSNSNEEFDEPTTMKKKKKKRKPDIDISNANSKEKDNIEVSEEVPEVSTGIENSTREIVSENSDKTKTELGFTVIGGKNKKTDTKKVDKSLPDWLAKPHIVDTDLSSNLLPVDELEGLSTHIQSRLHELKIKSFFPIQKAVIPAILNQMQAGSLYGLGGYRPSDICVSAPTGSGKTLSYVIPIVQALGLQTVCLLQALVLLPTKDLAFQVKQVFEAFIKGTGLKVGLASGNKSLAKEQESLIGQG